jgi:hypothetical protein
MGRFWALPLPEVMENLIVGRQLIKNANDNSSITKPNSRYSAVQYLSNVVGYVNIWTKPGYWDGPPCLLCLFSRVSCESATRGWILLLFRLTTVTKYSDTDKQTNRQTDKQTNRQTDKQTNTQTPMLSPVYTSQLRVLLSSCHQLQTNSTAQSQSRPTPTGLKGGNRSTPSASQECFALLCLASMGCYLIFIHNFVQKRVKHTENKGNATATSHSNSAIAE